MPTSPSMKTLTTFWTSTTCQISLSHPPSLLPSLRMRSLTRETSENEAKTRRRNARRRESFQLLPAQRTMRRLSTTVPRKICSWSCTCVSLCILSNIYTIGNPEIQRQERADLCSGRSLESGSLSLPIRLSIEASHCVGVITRLLSFTDQIARSWYNDKKPFRLTVIQPSGHPGLFVIVPIKRWTPTQAWTASTSIYTSPIYQSRIIVQIPTTVPRMTVSLRRRELIIPSSELMPGNVPEHGGRFASLKLVRII